MPRRMLLVDDDPGENGELVAALDLLRAQIEIETVPDLSGAIERLSEGPTLTLVLVDWGLANGYGLEVIRWLRGNPELMTMPAVVMLDNDDPRNMRVSLDTGANAHVVKPCSTDNVNEFTSRIESFWLGACALEDDLLVRVGGE